MIEISLIATVMRDPELLFAELNRELVIFHIKRGAYFSLDEIGADIWRRIEQPLTVAALCEALVNEYTADRATIEGDVLALFARMRAADLIEVRQP
jgi:hypothetical protein